MPANIIEVIVLGKDQASKVLGSAVSGLGTVAAGVATGGLALAAAAVVGLGAAAVGATVGITKLTFAAADVEGTRLTFERLTDEFNGSHMAMQDLQEATRGMVGEADLMAASNKFLTMGIAENTEETAKMAEMATQLGLAMGEDATASMENFALMMANQSIPRLDSFGISSSIVRERIKELQAATEGLSREEAFKIAVMEQGEIAMEKVGEQGDNATATTLRWKAAIADLGLGIGQAFIPALEAIRKPVLELVEKYGPDVILWAEMAGDWLAVKIPWAIGKLEDAWTRYWPEASKTLINFWTAIKPSLIRLKSFLFEDIPRAVENLKALWLEYWPIAKSAVLDFWDRIKPALEWVRDMLQRFTSTFLPHLSRAWDTLKRGWNEISAIYKAELKPAIQDLLLRLQPLWDALGIGTGQTDDIAEKFGDFSGVLSRILALGLIDSIKSGIRLLTWAIETGVHWGIRIRDTFHSIQGVFDRVRNNIQRVKDMFWELRNAIANFELPWWLIGRSPTPLETGLTGIAKALADVQGLAGGGFAFGGMTLAGAGAGAGPGIGGGGVTTIRIINNFGRDSIRSDEDVLAVADATTQSLELRGIGPVL